MGQLVQCETATIEDAGMSVANVAEPSSVVLSLALIRPRALSCAFQTTTEEDPSMVVPPGRLPEPAVAAACRSALIAE
jgi:hypothetical protein